MNAGRSPSPRAVPAIAGMLGALGVLLLLLAACQVQGGAGRRGGSLTEEARAYLGPDTVRSRTLADGVLYHFVWSPRGPWAAHLVSAEVARCELDLRVVPALDADGAARERKPLLDMAPGGGGVGGGGGAPLVGVNGDFFRLDNGVPLGSEVTPSTRRFANRPALAWGRGRVPWIGVPERDGESVGFGPDTVRSDGPPTGVREVGGTQVVGGYPELLDGGAVAGDLGVAHNPGFAAARHPRTAIGFDRDERLLWLVVVDGRQAPRSAGMSLPELAALFAALGAEDALNLDGGGSTAMALGETIVNRPSDAGRPLGNSLWLVRDEEGCAAEGRGSG